MPTSIEALVIVALGLAPGYLCIWCARHMLIQRSKQSDVEFVIAVVAVGVLIHLAAYPYPGHIILRHYQNGTLLDHQVMFFVWGFITVFILPLVLGFGFAALLKCRWKYLARLNLDKTGRIPRAWDFAWRREEGCYVQVHLKDGGVIGGTFSDQSSASHDSDYLDLYLEQKWDIDDGYLIPSAYSCSGVWLSPDIIARIEFVNGENQDG